MGDAILNNLYSKQLKLGRNTRLLVRVVFEQAAAQFPQRLNDFQNRSQSGLG